MVVLSKQSGCWIASISGEVDVSNAHEIRTFVETASEGESNVIVSFEECRSCDSSGLSVLIALHRKLGSKLIVVVAPGSSFHRMLRVTGIVNVLPLEETLQSALDRFADGKLASNP
jgi:anti-anti-sigma factor